MNHAQRCVSDQAINRTDNLTIQTAIVVLREDHSGHKNERKDAPYYVVFLHFSPELAASDSGE